MSQTTDNQTSSSTVALAGSRAHSAISNPTGQSVIGPTLVVRGEVTADEDLLVRGRVEGTISHNQTLTVHQQGTVVAAVRAKEIHVEGSVEGDLFGTQRIKVCETGKVSGNVVAPRVAVMDGARLKGMVDMDSDAAAIERRFAEQAQTAAPAAAKSGSKSGSRKPSDKTEVKSGGDSTADSEANSSEQD